MWVRVPLWVQLFLRPLCKPVVCRGVTLYGGRFRGRFRADTKERGDRNLRTLGTATYRKPLRKSMTYVGAILVADDAIYPKGTYYQIV